ncbi:hypothetical protein D9O40_03520 [Clostridium autoethanogenum]|uniref:Uncharacterized protein n=1 Tax=Clostridium autoethanogenum TaxID=84023 RepID=A0A3M0SXT3_9CLOT|nr:hypothetical protein [Clostridium autoethanogenum]RMD03223.1 hypothetical protein D9O40_03520 [Clostridium autoethanogenum]
MSCFALRRGKCSILDVKKCEGSDCNFYKTEAQVKKERKKVFGRIKTLDRHIQIHISETYYGGKMPWLKGGINNEC